MANVSTSHLLSNSSVARKSPESQAARARSSFPWKREGEKMQIREGNRYQLVNLDVPQGTPGNPPRIVVREVLEYKSQYIVYGAKPAHQQHVYRVGFETIPERYACFVLLPGERNERNVLVLSGMLGGLPLALQDGQDLYYIVNWGSRLGSLWSTEAGRQPSRDELVYRGRKVVDLYVDWEEKHEVPEWFRLARGASPN